MTAAPEIDRLVVVDQHRQRAGGIERQELLAPLPGLILDERRRPRRIRRARDGRNGRRRTADGDEASASIGDVRRPVTKPTLSARVGRRAEAFGYRTRECGREQADSPSSRTPGSSMDSETIVDAAHPRPHRRADRIPSGLVHRRISSSPGTSSASRIPARTFEVLIQLGAILAILTVYSGRLVTLARDAAARPRAQRFVARHPHRLPAGRVPRRPPPRLHQDGPLRVAGADLRRC